MMKIRQGFMLRNVLDMYVVIGIGKDAYIPNAIMSTNETGAFLWGLLEKGAEQDELVNALLAEYEVSREQAETDVTAFLAQLRERKLMEG